MGESGTLRITWVLPDSTRLPIEIAFIFDRGCAPQEPSYSSGGEPGWPDAVEIEGAYLIDADGERGPSIDSIETYICNHPKVIAACLEKALTGDDA